MDHFRALNLSKSESFRALKLSCLENFRALQLNSDIGSFIIKNHVVHHLAIPGHGEGDYEERKLTMGRYIRYNEMGPQDP